MASLTVSLEEGFADDTVVVAVNDVERYRREHVTTKLQVGLADQVRIDVPEGVARIDVALPAKGIAGGSEVDLAGDVFVGVSVAGAVLRFRSSPRAFGYA